MKIARKAKDERKIVAWVFGDALVVSGVKASMPTMCINENGEGNVWCSKTELSELNYNISETSYPVYEGDEVTLKF